MTRRGPIKNKFFNETGRGDNPVVTKEEVMDNADPLSFHGTPMNDSIILQEDR